MKPQHASALLFQPFEVGGVIQDSIVRRVQQLVFFICYHLHVISRIGDKQCLNARVVAFFECIWCLVRSR
jgi:hypothetical protein